MLDSECVDCLTEHARDQSRFDGIEVRKEDRKIVRAVSGDEIDALSGPLSQHLSDLVERDSAAPAAVKIAICAEVGDFDGHHAQMLSNMQRRPQDMIELLVEATLIGEAGQLVGVGSAEEALVQFCQTAVFILELQRGGV